MCDPLSYLVCLNLGTRYKIYKIYKIYKSLLHPIPYYKIREYKKYEKRRAVYTAVTPQVHKVCVLVELE